MTKFKFGEWRDYGEVKEALVDYSRWASLAGDELLDFLQLALLLYGQTENIKLVPHLTALYGQAVLMVDPEHRQLRLQWISTEAVRVKAAACTLLPTLVVDTDPPTVATALLDYIALCHPAEDGLPHEFVEFDALFRGNMFSCPGGVLGGFITAGDRRFHPKMHEWKQFLTTEEVGQAVRCRTPQFKHGEVLFWLDWATELVDQSDERDGELFGHVASAIALLGSRNPRDLIRDTERRFPAYLVEAPVVELAQWTRSEYAKTIADRLYYLEATEQAPKLFSTVLNAWGLQPRAEAKDQYVWRSDSA